MPGQEYKQICENRVKSCENNNNILEQNKKWKKRKSFLIPQVVELHFFRPDYQD